MNATQNLTALESAIAVIGETDTTRATALALEVTTIAPPAETMVTVETTENDGRGYVASQPRAFTTSGQVD